MRWSKGAAIMLAALLAASPASAASQQDRDDCERESMATAIAACSRVLDDPMTRQRVPALINRAAAYYATGEFGRSIADYDAAIRIEPNNATALFGRGSAKRRIGDAAGSEADFAAARAVMTAERNTEREAERQRVQEIARIATPSARQQMAWAARQKSCNEDTVRLVASIREENERADRDLAAIKGDAAKLCQYGKTQSLPRLGRQASALAVLQDRVTAASCDATNVIAASNVQMLAFRNSTRAVANDCQQANLPAPPLTTENRAWIICSTAPAEAAIAACTEIIDAPDELAEARRNALLRRAVLRHATDYAGAIADLDAAVKLMPDSAVAHARRCWARAIVHRDLDKALADCNEALRLAPEFYGALDSRGLAYLQMGELDKSVADYDAALDIAPALATSRYGRGIAKHRKGDVNGGDIDLALARKVDPGVTALMEHYGLK